MDTSTLITAFAAAITAIGVIAAIYYSSRNLALAERSNSESNEPSQHSVDVAGALIEKYKKESDDKGELIKTLSKAVEALTAEQSDPDAPEGIAEALACLERGDTDKAETIFQKIVEAKEAEGQTSFKQAAQAAMHIGALAFLHDTEKALAAYKKATQLNPDDANAWNRLGGLLLRIGDLPGTEHALEKVLALGNATADKTTIAAATGNLGLIARTRGDLDRAEDYHRQSLDIDTELGRKEGMASQLGNLGSVAQQRGDKPEAWRLWREALVLFQAVGMPHMVEQVQGALDKAGCDAS